MPAIVELILRKDTNANFLAANGGSGTVLADGEIGYVNSGTYKGKFKIGDGTTAWGSLAFQGDLENANAPLALTDGELSLSIGTGLTTNGSNQLVPDFGTTSGKVLDGAHAGASGVHGVTGSVVGTTDSQSLSNKTIVNSKDKWNVVASAATGTINFDVATSLLWLYTTNATANYTLNVRGNSGTTLNSLMATGESVTLTFMHQNGTTAYYPTTFQIDGTTLTGPTAIKWQITGAPAAGDPSNINAYTLTIIKTGSNAYTVLGSQTRFA